MKKNSTPTSKATAAVAPVSTPVAGTKKASKKATPAPAPAPVSTPAPADHKAAVIVRPETMVGKMYSRLLPGQPITTAELFKDLGSSDANQLITDLRRIGKKSGEFVINRVAQGTYQLAPVK